MSETNRGRLSYVAEGSFGVAPTNPVFQILRMVSSDLSYSKETTQSNELDSGRMTADMPEVGASASGSVSIEWSPASYDELIEAALGGTRSTKVELIGVDSTNEISINQGTPTDTQATLTDSAGNSLFGDLEEDQFVYLEGFTNATNNGWFQIKTVTDANTLVLHDPSDKMITESAGTGAKLVGQTVTNGTTSRSFTLEESYLDVLKHRLFVGQRISSMSMDLSTGSIATGSFGFMGTEVSIYDGATPTWLGTGSRTAAGTTSVLNSTSNVGDVLIGGELSSACFQSLSLNLDNSMRSIQCIGSKFPKGINYGRQTVSGNISNMFADWTLYEKMLNHEDVSLSFGMVAPGGGGIHIYLPRVTLSNDTVNLSGGNDSDVTESIDWTALKSSDGYQIRVDIAS